MAQLNVGDSLGAPVDFALSETFEITSRCMSSISWLRFRRFRARDLVANARA
jgi:hypothetical protein